MKKKNRVSSKDVAREAGVSQATVSYVLNDVKHIKIRPETRQAVWDAVKKLNYHPSHIARGMRLNKSMSVGVISDRSVTNYNFMKTLEGIKVGLAKFNYSITLLYDTSEENFPRELISYYKSNRLDGFIYAFALLDESIREELDNKKIPYVIIDSHAHGRGSHEVGTDYLNHLPTLTAVFKKKGAKKLAYFGPRRENETDPRIEAYLDALKGNALHNSGIHLCSFNDDEIQVMAHKILLQSESPQGILAGTPRFGFHVLKAAAKLGIDVPGKLSVACLGTSAFHGLCHPSMTAVELPLFEMGRTGAEMLANLMNDQEGEELIVLPSEIVMRESL